MLSTVLEVAGMCLIVAGLAVAFGLAVGLCAAGVGAVVFGLAAEH